MSFKDILVALTTYPQPTPVSAVEEAVELAAALGGRISAIACEVKIKAPGSPMGNYLLDIPAMVAAENAPGVKGVNDHLAWVEPMSGMAFSPSDESMVQAKAS
jgi:hypothetical protein